MEERSVMRKVRAVSSGESEFHGLGTGVVTRLLMKYICRREREEKKKNLQFTLTQLQVIWNNSWARVRVATTK